MVGLVSVMMFGGLVGCDRNAKDLVPTPKFNYWILWANY